MIVFVDNHMNRHVILTEGVGRGSQLQSSRGGERGECALHPSNKVCVTPEKHSPLWPDTTLLLEAGPQCRPSSHGSCDGCSNKYCSRLTKWFTPTSMCTKTCLWYYMTPFLHLWSNKGITRPYPCDDATHIPSRGGIVDWLEQLHARSEEMKARPRNLALCPSLPPWTGYPTLTHSSWAKRNQPQYF